MIDDKIETAESALNDLEAEKRSSAERTAKLEEIQTQAQKKIDEFTSQLDSVNEKITEIESRRDELLSTREQNADKESSINLSILAFKRIFRRERKLSKRSNAAEAPMRVMPMSLNRRSTP